MHSDMSSISTDSCLAEMCRRADVAPETRECSICYETLDPRRNMCVTPCGHDFCFVCIMTSLAWRTSCPCCREPLMPTRATDATTTFGLGLALEPGLASQAAYEMAYEAEEGEILEDSFLRMASLSDPFSRPLSNDPFPPGREWVNRGWTEDGWDIPYNDAMEVLTQVMDAMVEVTASAPAPSAATSADTDRTDLPVPLDDASASINTEDPLSQTLCDDSHKDNRGSSSPSPYEERV
jgi:hypothetical protein